METLLAINTNGDPIGAVQRIVLLLWEQLNLEAIIAPVEDPDKELPKARVIRDTKIIKNLNPFKPVMVENSARLVSELISNYPDIKLGTLLRPCEINTLIELSLLGKFSLQNIITISFDCLGTLPIEEYLWKVKHKPVSITQPQKDLQFSRQGGILSYKNRPACQICSAPEAKNADLNINVFGLPVRKAILIKKNGMNKKIKLDFRNLMYDKPEQDLVKQHKKTASRIIERNNGKFLRIVKELEQILPENLNELITQFRQCSSCLKIRDICPICGLLLQKTINSRDITRLEMIRWLVTCSGCGMCESVCPEHQSLNLIFKFIRSRLEEESFPLPPFNSKYEILM